MQDAAHRDNWEYVLDSSRRARGFVVYAALRSLGRRGVREMVERCCHLARRMAEQLAAAPGVHVLNEVVLNQVLVRFGDDETTRAVFGRTYAAEPEELVRQLAEDSAIAAADTLLLTVPNQLGVDYNAHVIESVLRYVAPELGWR